MNKKIFAILAVCAMVMTACGPVVEESAQLPETSEKTTSAAEAETTTEAEAETTTVAEATTAVNNDTAETTVQASEKTDSNKMAELSAEPPVYTKYLTSENSKMPELPENRDEIPELNTDLSQFVIPDYLDYSYKAISYDYNGTELTSCRLVLYNSHNDEVFSSVYNIGFGDESWTAPYYVDYEYDANGNPTRISRYNEDGLESEQNTTYDANGNVTYSERYDAMSGVTFHTTNAYDQYGNVLVSEGVNNLDGEFKDSYTYEYDANGNVVYGKGNVTNPWAYNEFRQRFDDRGNVIEYVGKCDKVEESHRELAYDENNNCVYEKYYNSDESSSITEYLYDGNNNCICEIGHNIVNGAVNSSWAEFYEFNETGRVTKRYSQSSDSEDSFTLYVYEELS